jgi:hypothetical protein
LATPHSTCARRAGAVGLDKYCAQPSKVNEKKSKLKVWPMKVMSAPAVVVAATALLLEGTVLINVLKVIIEVTIEVIANIKRGALLWSSGKHKG